MKLELTELALSQIMTVCSPHVDKKKFRPSLTYIHITFDGEKAMAVSLDGCKLAQTIVSATGDIGEYVIPVVKLPKKFGFCTIENTDLDITLDFKISKIVERKLEGVEPIGDVSRFLPKSEVKVRRGFNAKYMSDVMKSFGTQKLTFELRSAGEGMIITGETGSVMILPIRLENSI